MDFVRGIKIEDCWEDLNQIERKDVGSKVASIINNLHSLPIPEGQELVPGPVGFSACVPRARFFPDIGIDPFSSTEQLEAWYNRRLEITQHFHQAPPDAAPFVFNSYTYIHYDFAPRNLILDSDGKIRLIDWGDAGIYPEGFEFAALNTRKDQSSKFIEMPFRLIPSYEDLSRQMLLIAYNFTTAQWIDSRWIQ
ncbi:Aminoglycoside phosphotransferase [Penicillium expansum]|nr:Aminoglycoside phosphotransferase [Penicillium expansum]